MKFEADTFINYAHVDAPIRTVGRDGLFPEWYAERRKKVDVHWYWS